MRIILCLSALSYKARLKSFGIVLFKKRSCCDSVNDFKIMKGINHIETDEVYENKET